MSVLYYTPWLSDTPREMLLPYIVAFFWFLIVWIAAIYYGVKAFKLREKNPNIGKKYFYGLVAIVASYCIVWFGVFNGYLVSV